MFCWVPQPQYFHSYILKWLGIIYVCLYEMRNQKFIRAQVRVRVIRSLPWWLRCSHGRKGGEAGSRPSSTCMTMPSTHLELFDTERNWQDTKICAIPILLNALNLIQNHLGLLCLQMVPCVTLGQALLQDCSLNLLKQMIDCSDQKYYLTLWFFVAN